MSVASSFTSSKQFGGRVSPGPTRDVKGEQIRTDYDYEDGDYEDDDYEDDDDYDDDLYKKLDISHGML